MRLLLDKEASLEYPKEIGKTVLDFVIENENNEAKAMIQQQMNIIP